MNRSLEITPVIDGTGATVLIMCEILVNDLRVGSIVAGDSHHDNQAHIEWRLHEAHRGKGHASWALREALPTLLTQWNRLVAIIRPGNFASKKLAAAVGFIHEGTAREGRFIDGAYEDVEHWAIIARDLAPSE